MNAAWVALGGAVGCVCRYGVATALGPQPFPFATLAVNVAGSLLLGILSELALGGRVGPPWIALVGVGFCGGFTTMSTFSVETLRLPLSEAVANVVGNVGLCLVSAWVGMRIGRVLSGS